MNTWLKLAVRSDVVVRSVKIAAVVGTILALINHYDRILAGSWTTTMVIKIVLTYLVPYGVSTVAAVQALRGRDRQ
jgi:hypothetical protein